MQPDLFDLAPPPQLPPDALDVPPQRATGKTVEALQQSRAARDDVLQRLGGEVPESVLSYDRTVKALDVMAEQRSYASTANTGGHTGKLASVFDVSGQSCRDGALSRFPQNVGRKLVLFYTDENDLVVDPFAGHNSRMELCLRASRRYWGNDISDHFQQANETVYGMLLEEAAHALIPTTVPECRLTTGDSRSLPWPDDSGDFTITSPPYWDLENYGDEYGQLGVGKTYSAFLHGLAVVAAENYRVLKAGAFCVWCVNDFRKGGKFYSYHEDTCDRMRAAGFEQWDMAITDLGPAMRAAFANQAYETKILPKRHEYCLVFRKP